jgi:hypothetical protein
MARSPTRPLPRNDADANLTHAVSKLHAGLFAGAALYISAVEHPAAMEADVSSFYKFFPHMYKRYSHPSTPFPSARPCSEEPLEISLPMRVVLRAAPIQGSLAILGSVSAAVAASNGGHCSKFMWGGAGLLLGSVWPFTVLAMFPTNNKIKLQVIPGHLSMSYGSIGTQGRRAEPALQLTLIEYKLLLKVQHHTSLRAYTAGQHVLK